MAMRSFGRMPRFAGWGSPAMKAVLFATRMVPALALLTDESCVALLSVVCKPLIVHTIESLAMAGLNDVIVIVSSHANAVKAALGDGSSWGMRFEYVFATGEEGDEETVERIRARLGDEYLLVRGEMLRTPIIAEFLERSQLNSARLLIATIGKVDAGVRRIKCRTSLREKDLNEAVNPDARMEDQDEIEFPQGRLSLLESLAPFHRANLDILAGHFPGIIIPGREIAPMVRVGRRTKFSKGAIKASPIIIGARCSIADNAEFGPEVVISNDVVVDDRVVIRSSVIMPNTYLGKLVEVSNAIVTGDRLIHIDTGTSTTVVDSFLLAKIRRAEIGAGIRNLADRAIGAVLLVASLWLWPIALIAAVTANPRRPIRKTLLLGNRRREHKLGEFTSFEFATAIPLLRHLPYLFAVVSGHLALIGVEPLKAASRPEERELISSQRKAGFFVRRRLTSSEDTRYERYGIPKMDHGTTNPNVRDLKDVFPAAATLMSGHTSRPIKPAPSELQHTLQCSVESPDALSQRIDENQRENMTTMEELNSKSAVASPKIDHGPLRYIREERKVLDRRVISGTSRQSGG
jgi:mannose-1-phosphate guanylyltransferase / phosphomannomutase